MTAAGAAETSSTRTCAACRMPVATRFCTACGADAGGARLPLPPPSSEVERLVHRVNAGAALLPGFWTYAHGAPVLGTLFWLSLLPFPFVSVGIAAYLFYNGNRVALQRRRFADPDEFRRVQRAWTIAGLAVMPLELLVLIAYLAAIVSLAQSGALR